jgi:phosphoribosyl 1,2-cyclic phosphate phosphodiesterase
MKFLFLGTGASSGVPVVGCKCSVCKSKNIHNNRLRTSGLLQIDGKNFLIDASPDIRLNALEYEIDSLDGVFLTHPHEDHIGGLNDLRPYSFLNQNKQIPLVLSEVTLNVLHVRFDYLMDRFLLETLKEKRGQAFIKGVEVRYFSYSQQGLRVNGFRFDKFAYVTDIKDYEEAIFDDLDGVETLVLGAINEKDSRMHFSIQEAIEFKKKNPSVKRCYLTHLSHEVDYETISKALPEGVMLAYDGLELDV